MKKIDVDVAVIGAGSAGLTAYRSALKCNKKVVLIEGGPYGTTCARVGCMPSKLLIAAAEAAYAVKEASAFGIYPDVESIVDGKKVMERVRSERDRFVGFVLDSVKDMNDESKIRGFAKFVSSNVLHVDDHTQINMKSAVIATGSTPFVPEMFRGLGERLIINDDVFSWNDLPKSVAVFGMGIIGLELGQALSRLGVKTVFFRKGTSIGPIKDPEILNYADKHFTNEVTTYNSENILNMHKLDESIKIEFKDGSGKEMSENFEYVLAATGRTPNVNKLGLENTELKLDEKGVPEFNRYTMQCGETSIFIAGDVNNDVPLLHEAAAEGRIAGFNAANYPEVIAECRGVPLSIVFTDPQIAIVGSLPDEIKEGTYVTGKFSFEDQGRSRVILKNKGLMNIYAEYGSGLLLGAEIFGPRAEHLGHLLAWCIENNNTVPEMLDMPFYHPVIEEGLRTALRNTLSKLEMGPPFIMKEMECGPGV